MNRSKYRFLSRASPALFLGYGGGSIEDLQLFWNQPFMATMSRILPLYAMPELHHLGAGGKPATRRLYRRRYAYGPENDKKLIQYYYIISTPDPIRSMEPEKILSGAYQCIDWAELACISDAKIGGKTLYRAVSTIRKAGNVKVEIAERPWILVRIGEWERKILDINESYEAASEAMQRGGWSSKEGWVRLPPSGAEIPHPAAAAVAETDMATSCRRWIEDKHARSAAYAPLWHYIARHALAQRIFMRGLGLEMGSTRINPWGALIEKALSIAGAQQTLYLMERAAMSISAGISSLTIHDLVACTSLHINMVTGDDDLLVAAAFASAYTLSKAMAVGWWRTQIPGAGSGPEAMFVVGDRLATADLAGWAQSIQENIDSLSEVMDGLASMSRSYVIRMNTIWFGGCTKNRGIYRRECGSSNHYEALKEAVKRVRSIVGDPPLRITG